MAQGIYKIINVLNNKFYVGSAVDFTKRKDQHWYRLRKGNHVNKHLQAAWNKYGEKAFIFAVIQEVPVEENLLAAENIWLREHVGTDNCYNIARDAAAPNKGLEHSQATKNKISASRTGKGAGEHHYRYGKTLSNEVKTKIANTQRGKQKGPRTFTPDGLRRAQENMKRNAQVQLPAAFSTVYAKFPQEVKDKYDFQNAVYTQALIRIEGVICHKHGVFSQYAAQFRKGRGCPACGAEERAISKSAQMKAAWKDESYRANTIAQQNVGKKKK